MSTCSFIHGASRLGNGCAGSISRARVHIEHRRVQHSVTVVCIYSSPDSMLVCSGQDCECIRWNVRIFFYRKPSSLPFFVLFLLKHFYVDLEGSFSLSVNVGSNLLKTVHICFVTFIVLTLLKLLWGGDDTV